MERNHQMRLKIVKKILSDEIKLINPKIICTLGKLPFKTITGERGNLRDYVNEMAEYGRLKIFPCYFPTGKCPIKDEIKISYFKNLKELCEKLIST